MPNRTSSPSRRDATKSATASEKRGGYGSSSRLVTTLAPPPSGPAPGAKKPAPTPNGANQRPSKGDRPV